MPSREHCCCHSTKRTERGVRGDGLSTVINLDFEPSGTHGVIYGGIFQQLCNLIVTAIHRPMESTFAVLDALPMPK